MLMCSHWNIGDPSIMPASERVQQAVNLITAEDTKVKPHREQISGARFCSRCRQKLRPCDRRRLCSQIVFAVISEERSAIAAKPNDLGLRSQSVISDSITIADAGKRLRFIAQILFQLGQGKLQNACCACQQARYGNGTEKISSVKHRLNGSRAAVAEGRAGMVCVPDEREMKDEDR